jgi:N-acetylneuraminic acid mutarotase
MTKLTRRGFTAGALALSASGPAMACRAVRADLGGEWGTYPALPFRTQEIYPATLDGQIYVAGGLSPDVSERPLDIAARFVVWSDRQIEPGSDIIRVSCRGDWSDLSPLPEPRHHPNLVGQDGTIFAIGGFAAGDGGAWRMLANASRYSVEDDSWSEVNALPRPFGETVAAALLGHIHVATGRQPIGSANANWSDHGDVGTHYVYDITEGRWREAAPNPNPRNSAAGAVLDDRLHVVGGRRVNAGNEAHHEAYDPVTDSWHQLAPLPQGQGGLAAAVANGKLYAFGGEWFAGDGGVYPHVWIYDPATDSWEAGPEMRTPRHGLGGVTVRGSIFAIGGATQRGGNGTSDRVEVLGLDPDSSD